MTAVGDRRVQAPPVNVADQPLAVRRNRSLAALGPLIRHQMQKTSPSDEALASLFTTLETVPATPLS